MPPSKWSAYFNSNERDGYVLAALNGGNQAHTAEQLRIGSATLVRRLESYGSTGGKRVLRKGAPTRS